MDYRQYRQQIEGLAAYRNMSEVPRDPYDVQVGLARRLVAYDAIRLSPAQQFVYGEAVARSHEKGPCCCHCWRWTAFRGQAKFLITRHHSPAAEVARLWNLEDGCGGGKEPGRSRS